MKKIFFGLFVSFLLSCNYQIDKEQTAMFSGRFGNEIIRTYIEDDKIFGEITESSLNGSDTILVNLLFKDPLFDVRVDSVYFFYANENVFKCLFTTEWAKHLMYIEGNHAGQYNEYTYFGGLVTDVNYIEAIEKRNTTNLKFKVTATGNFGFNYEGFCKIESSNKDISFDVNCDE